MSALAEQHERWVGARERLYSGKHVAAPKAQRPRPVSPFVVDTLARREAAKKAREEAIAWLRKHPPHWSAIVKQVAKKHGLKSSDLLGPARFKKIVAARNEAYYRLRTEITVNRAPLSFPMIAKRFKKDHSSVLHGFYKHAALVGDTNEVIHSINRSHRERLTLRSFEVARGSEPLQTLE